MDDTMRISVTKLIQTWNPFEKDIWVKVDSPITRERCICLPT